MKNSGGYSKIIRPLLYIIDLFIISIISYYFLTDNVLDIIFFNGFWILLSIILSFYNVYRFTKIIKIVALLFKQITLLLLLIFAYLYISKSYILGENVLKYFISLFLVLTFWRILLYEVFKKYRIITGSNYRQVIVIGSNTSTKKLITFFNSMPEYGYRYQGFFSNENEHRERIGSVEDSFDYILRNNIDEVYCSIRELSNNQIRKLIEFCEINQKVIKFIADDKELFTKNIELNYYNLTPIISLAKIPLDDPLNKFVKRTFDFLFALIVILFLLSWLIPILAVIIKLESKGPVFFRQNRPGINGKGFNCYKFRSMTINDRSEDSAIKNDPRVTKVGKFIRRTSIDELPQFFNVLFGEMSIVGPRPHLWRQNKEYGPYISKYMIRHFVKPGITGLAQIKGYRGEIQTKKDIVNRTKYDVFYIENWSFLMDAYIIVQTISNVINGEENAY